MIARRGRDECAEDRTVFIRRIPDIAAAVHEIVAGARDHAVAALQALKSVRATVPGEPIIAAAALHVLDSAQDVVFSAAAGPPGT